MDKDKIIELKEAAVQMADYLNKASKYSEGKEWIVGGNLPPEFHSIMANDIIFGVFKDIIFENPDKIEALKRLLITGKKVIKVEIDNPLLKRDKEINEHRIAQYEVLIDLIDNFKPDTQPEGKKVPDKYYSLLHLILMYLGKDPQIGSKSKQEIIDLGKKKYGTGQGFYRQIKEIDLLNMIAYVKSLPQKDHKKWKDVIIEISGNDADVISWVKKQPN